MVAVGILSLALCGMLYVRIPHTGDDETNDKTPEAFIRGIYPLMPKYIDPGI